RRRGPGQGRRHRALREGREGRAGVTSAARRNARPRPRSARVAPSARADLEARRAEVAHLRHELDETNRGLIALYAELDQARAAEARLATIVQSSDDAIFSTTLDPLIATWHPRPHPLLAY